MKPSPVRDIDVALLTKRSPLVATILPSDDLGAIASDYVTLHQLAEQKRKTKFQSSYYQACLDVLSDYDVALFRRNLALLLAWVGNLWIDEYESYVAFAKARAGIGRSQARKAYLSALMILYFDGAGKRDLKPAGEYEEKLMVLLPDHWLPAWERVLASVEAGEVLMPDHVVTQLHKYGEEFPSALRSRTDRGKYDPPIRAGKKAQIPARHRLQLTAAGQVLEFKLAQSQIGDQVAKLAMIHKSGMAEFVLGALKHRKPRVPSPTPASAWTAMLRKFDPEFAAAVDHAAAEGVLRFLEAAALERHRHLENRRNEYLRRCARAQNKRNASAQPSSQT